MTFDPEGIENLKGLAMHVMAGPAALLPVLAADYGAGPRGGRRRIIPPHPVKTYYVFILTNRTKTLYTGATNALDRRVLEHKQKRVSGFTSRYCIDRLVYYEEFSDVEDAIAREKQIKGWLRRKKIDLIESSNPGWDDLSEGWFD